MKKKEKDFFNNYFIWKMGGAKWELQVDQEYKVE